MSLVERPPTVRQDRDGVFRIADTRVTLDVIVAAFESGASAEQIAIDYDVLDLGDVYAAIGFYLHHRDEVASYLIRRRSEAGSLRQTNEARWPAAGVRERLANRRLRPEPNP